MKTRSKGSTPRRQLAVLMASAGTVVLLSVSCTAPPGVASSRRQVAPARTVTRADLLKAAPAASSLYLAVEAAYPRFLTASVVSPLVYVDGRSFGTMEQARHLPMRDVRAVRFLTLREHVARFDQRHPGFVIEVFTRDQR